MSTAEPEDPLEFRIYPGTDADFTLYEDAGDNYDYEKAAFTHITMHWDDRRHCLVVKQRQGFYPGMLSTRHLQVIHRFPGQCRHVYREGTDRSILGLLVPKLQEGWGFTEGDITRLSSSPMPK